MLVQHVTASPAVSTSEQSTTYAPMVHARIVARSAFVNSITFKLGELRWEVKACRCECYLVYFSGVLFSLLCCPKTIALLPHQKNPCGGNMNHSRRSFVGTGIAAGLGVGLGLPPKLETCPEIKASRETQASGAALATSSQDSSFDPWVEIHPANLRHNVQEISRRVAGRPILAVIKNNGYGMGVVNVAHLLDSQAEIFGFAVVKLHEGMSLRDAGIRKPILLLGPFDDRNLEDAAARGILPMIYTRQGAQLDKIAAKLQRPVPLHICIDTGIGRVGVPYYQARPLISDLAARKSVHIQGTMMTFTEDKDFDPEQIRRFQETCASLEKDGIVLGKKHAASSFALFQHPDAFFDMVRPGMAIYGIFSENEFRHTGVLELRPAISLKARVIYVKKLRKGDSAGYERAYFAKNDVWVATLPVGHADGWPRVAAKGAKVRINGKLYAMIASVSASHCIVELGPGNSGSENAAPVEIGDIATFFDWQPGSRPEEISEACGASVYDLTMHLNPLLPRRVLAS
jgi:alanine racemase